VKRCLWCGSDRIARDDKRKDKRNARYCALRWCEYCSYMIKRESDAQCCVRPPWVGWKSVPDSFLAAGSKESA